MVGVTGIEPVTPSMSTKCSPAELYARLWLFVKSLLLNIEALYIAVLYALQVIFESFTLNIDSNYV